MAANNVPAAAKQHSMSRPAGSSSRISTHHTFLPSPLPSAPSFHIHLTRLRDTVFLWVGTSKPSDSGADGPGLNGEPAVSEPEERRLAADWAVAMPARGVSPSLRNEGAVLMDQVMPVSGTSIYRAGANDLALPMAKRLARRFPANQVHLSLSLPASLTPQGGASLDPFASKTLLLLEKRLVAWLEEVLGQAP